MHAAACGLSRATDADILARAAAEHRVLISADTDFGGLLAARQSTVPRSSSTAGKVAAGRMNRS